ncbi:MAG: SipW-dependent-type signal peptide-containing protein [Clostridia bacterium]|nr:SipW-dependent-type signal peptide-containing protein [Clostridia bacterium]
MKRNTKRSLLFSLLSLLLSCSMLIGTTFAWFTDSVTSANNIIKAGNLDMELEYWNGTSWKSVHGSSELLDDEALWEPGYTEVVYLRLINAGSLAFKYQLGVNIQRETPGVNAAGEEFKLSDYINFGVVENVNGETAAYATRQEAVDALSESKKISEGYAKEGTMLADAQDLYLAMVVYMPETVGNEANHNGEKVPQITLGVNVFAAQMAYESDSFGNEYDEDATYPIADYKEIGNEGGSLVAGDVTVKVPDTAIPGDYYLNVDNKHLKTTDGKTTVSYDIDLMRDGVKVENDGTVYTVSINVGKNLDIKEVLHAGTAVTSYDYDRNTGIVSFGTATFSPFSVSYIPWAAMVGSVEYHTIDEAIENWKNGTTLTLLNDVTLTDVIKLNSTEYHILDLGTYTMTAASGKDVIQYVVKGRSSASYALDIKADATNPGGITAKGKTIVSHIKPSSGAPAKDRPITRFYGGVFNASYVVKQGGSGLFLPGAGYTGASAPYFQFYGGEFNGTIYTNRSQNQFHGGTFNGSLQMSVDSSAYTMVAGGTFKNLSNLMGSALNSDKFVIGTAKGANNGFVCVNENGYYVVSKTVPANAEASVASNYSSNNYFYYSTVNTNGMYYEDVYDALEANKTGEVTVFVGELELSNTAFKGTIKISDTLAVTFAEGTEPAWSVESDEGAVSYTDAVANGVVTRTYTVG